MKFLNAEYTCDGHSLPGRRGALPGWCQSENELERTALRSKLLSEQVEEEGLCEYWV
jgi:hypothetical protein